MTFHLSFMRIDRDEQPTVVESFHRTVDWSLLPRVEEAVDLGNNYPVPVESVGYDFDGAANVFMGRIVLDDLQAAQLKKCKRSVGPPRATEEETAEGA